jgi:hypothetical protein
LGYRVPNGVEDTIEFRNGKYYFVKRVQEYELVSGDLNSGGISNINTELDLVSFNWVIPNYYISGTDIDGSGIFTDRTTPRMGVDSAWTHYKTTSTFRIVVPIGTYTTSAEAQADLVGTKILYQLATPIETEILSLGIPQSYQGGTIYIDDMMADADLYTTNALISNTAYPIKSLDRIVRINADGSQTELAVIGATIAGDKLSFTHTGLVANDIVWFSYTYDIANTFQSLTTATYYDNPFIAVAPNGTARRLVPTVDNAGAVTWTSVAI